MATETRISVGPRKVTIWDGWSFACGVALFLIAASLIGIVMDHLGLGTSFDDSDRPPYRSGLRISTDNLTGCQYFKSFLGGITPRVDRDGKQICAPR